MATIEDLKAAMSAKAPARPDRYRVRIPGLNAVGDILCQATNLPGRQITTTERRIGMVTQKMPYGFIFDDVSLTFLLDNEYVIKNYFEDWHEDIIGFDTYELKYKNDYSKTVEIQQLDKETESVVYGVRLKNAFPVTISPIELGDGLQNQITQVNVQLAFTDWERTT
jgi:hypothetical protein|tara:strand:+ start:23 stop:523 length:501 start_codon:yes stop_codon:yes gene_type:complete